MKGGGKRKWEKEVNFVKFSNLSCSYFRSIFYDQKMSNTALLPIKVIISKGASFENTIDDFTSKCRKVKL